MTREEIVQARMDARIEAMEEVDREVQARLDAPEVPVLKVMRPNQPLTV